MIRSKWGFPWLQILTSDVGFTTWMPWHLRVPFAWGTWNGTSCFQGIVRRNIGTGKDVCVFFICLFLCTFTIKYEDSCKMSLKPSRILMFFHVWATIWTDSSWALRFAIDGTIVPFIGTFWNEAHLSRVIFVGCIIDGNDYQSNIKVYYRWKMCIRHYPTSINEHFITASVTWKTRLMSS